MADGGDIQTHFGDMGLDERILKVRTVEGDNLPLILHLLCTMVVCVPMNIFKDCALMFRLSPSWAGKIRP